MNITFSDFFEVSAEDFDATGAFDISLIADLPLFIDPFLLFNSKNERFQDLHRQIIKYLMFLRDKSSDQSLERTLVSAWYTFPEVRQNWLGFSANANRGSGLGKGFATALNANLHAIFKDFGSEKITKESHLEKLCLIAPGVGRDKISDFTTNLIKWFLLEYTEEIAKKLVAPQLRRRVGVTKTRFNYDTESWEHGNYELPWFRGDYVILTPKEILTRDNTWINKTDLVAQFAEIPEAISND